MSFALYRPASLSEAVALAAQYGEDARCLAGGTDLVIQMHRGRLAPSHVIDLGRLDALRGIAEDPDGFTIGALTTHKAIERHPGFQAGLVALAEAARVVGGHQVRNIATIGGNIVNASPAADVVPVLLTLDATLALTGLNGSRAVALADFLIGPNETARRPGEILSEIRVRKLPSRSATAFLKAGRRRAMEISVVCVAARLTMDIVGACRDPAIALGAVAPTTVRARDAEAFLAGRPATATNFAEAGRLAAAACHPISDVRASDRYRRRLAAVLVERALARCTERVAAS